MRVQVQPGIAWASLRRGTQLLAVLAIVLAPFLGGWQRADRTELAVFSASGWDLPDGVRDHLSMGDRPAQAYDAIVLQGGGSAVEYVSIPAIDPVAGAAVFLRGGFNGKLFIAFLLPILLAVFAGRVFCGWFCPFGILARATRSILARLPWQPPVWKIPQRRPLRWIILIGTLVASALGAHAAVFFFLPHLLVQQTVYAYWLLGGGGAILGALLGLLLVGVVFGPTTYCAAICPTGAALGLAGRGKLVHLTMQEPEDCGKHCTLCDTACWLGLSPATGDPGPDCDSCGRCTAVCPRSNMRVVAGRPRRRHLPVIAAVLAVLCLPSVASAIDRAAPPKPEYLLNAERVIDGVTVAVSAVDFTGVKLDLDWAVEERGIELSVFIARGEFGPIDERGLFEGRDVYVGLLEVVIEREGDVPKVVSWIEQNSPMSTPGKSIYRRRIREGLGPNDRVIVRAIPGWLEHDEAWVLPPRGTAPGARSTLFFFLASALVFAGLCSLALAVPGSAQAGQSSATKDSEDSR